jgi:ankyrin repeat protein
MICHLLDKHNMDINQNNDDLRHFYHDSQNNGSPLCSAVLHKNLAVVHELLQRGARVNSPDWDPVSYAVMAGGFMPALEPLLRAGADTNKALKISVLRRNIDASKACLHFGADPAPALHRAIAQEEYKANTIAENAAYFESRPEFSYKKSESTAEKEMAEERESQAMVALLRSAMQ